MSQVFRQEHSYKNTDPKYKDAYNLDRGLMVMDKLMDMYPDLSIEQAAGIAGNFGVESYFNPAVQQGQLPNATGPTKGGGIGLAQWSGVRRKQLMERFPGEQWKNIDNQLKFMQEENAGPEKRNWQQILAQKTPEATSESFVRKWERAGVPAIEDRQQLSRRLSDSANVLAKKYEQDIIKRNAKRAQPMPEPGMWDKFLSLFNW